ncbi:acetyltransferase [Caldibacillus lycopersici]|uniref:Acetyltransferase n=1 Tax=Perspicuibacillus lycopersici TaxID=1325689 RepID=A0AAE3IUU8_9BACI|nr:acetyltransferase [Perspicuibacillus lycopersici]MCU9614627.1 acetyltransferase [Perspicuibacillus lycopersici]
MLKANDLLIRRMHESDFYWMVKWLNDEKVLEFYEEPPSSLEMVKEKYGPRIIGNHYVIACIVEYKNQPIGYMQYYEIQEMELKKYDLIGSENIYGIDQFIGEPKLWGKGIGTSMIKMLLHYLQGKAALTVVLEVNKRNIRAINSYKKCGFIKLKKLTDEIDLMGCNL